MKKDPFKDFPQEACFGGVSPPETVLVPHHEWQAARDKEGPGTIHPCNSWNINECDCKGACSCHWATKRRIKFLGGPEKELRKCAECDNKTYYWSPEEDKPLCDVCARKYGHDLLDRMTAKQYLEQLDAFNKAFNTPPCHRTGMHMFTSPMVERKCVWCGEVIPEEKV